LRHNRQTSMKNLSLDWLAVIIGLAVVVLIRAGVLPHIPW